MFEVQSLKSEVRSLKSEVWSLKRRIKAHTEGPLTSEALKLLSSHMSHYPCWPTRCTAEWPFCYWSLFSVSEVEVRSPKSEVWSPFTASVYGSRSNHWYTLRLDSASGVQSEAGPEVSWRPHVEWPDLRSEFYRFLLQNYRLDRIQVLDYLVIG
jgi:hypothetical protein